VQIFNSKTRKKELFIPLHEGHVGIYTCGPTVYNYFHIGNARVFIVFDVLRRYFEYLGYKVNFVQNFTDIDDKMINKAKEEGISVKELGDRFIREYFQDAAALGIRPATVHPRATEHIPQIIKLIQSLFTRGMAYEMDGDVYFSVRSFPDYGKLSGQAIEELDAGARVDVDKEKHDPADFALWKSCKENEPSWDSPWGKGRPGWHIECSAMSMEYLGESFDIHAGGKDLLFPHHENEIAQSEGSTGMPFVHYWMHNGFLSIDNEKMSKSTGNFFTVRDILKEYDAEAVRMFILSAQYRSPLNFSREMIDQAHSALNRMYIARDHMVFLLSSAADRPLNESERDFEKRIHGYVACFSAAMEDDLNTADAIGTIFDIVHECNISLDASSSSLAIKTALSVLTERCGILGLMMSKDNEIPYSIQQLADERIRSRKEKDWKRCDVIRNQIKAQGYIIEDTPQGQKIRKIL
jgi:cysteinyl-tRNA synthetase